MAQFTVEKLLEMTGLIDYAKGYPDFVKLFGHHINVINVSNTSIHFQYRNTEYKAETKFYPEFNQYCSIVYKANKSTHFFFKKCRCVTRTDERNYPVLAGYIATVLTNNANKLMNEEKLQCYGA